jgi:hypothetical protein
MVAAEEGLGWKPGTFLAAYEKNRTEAMVDAAALDPLANCFLALVAKLTQFRLTATELMHRLNEVADQQTKNSRPRWLVHPQVLTRMLRRLAPALRAMGVILVMDEERDENNVKLIEVKAEDDDPNNW